MKLIKKCQFGVIKITDENDAPIASFSNDAAGVRLYDYFKAGLGADQNGPSLFDADLDQYVVGSVAELVA